MQHAIWPFLSSAEAVKRARFALRISVLTWLGALTAWLTGADAALLRWLDTSPLVSRLRPFFDWYSDWGPALFYAFFIALFTYGMRSGRPLPRLAALTYIHAQVFGTLLLIRLIKIGCGRPRPHVEPMHGALCGDPSLAHAFNSFPSSHAVNAMVGAMFVLFLLRTRTAASFGFVAAALMASARILLGEHHLSDVLAGMALGVAIAAGAMHGYLIPRWRALETAPAR